MQQLARARLSDPAFCKTAARLSIARTSSAAKTYDSAAERSRASRDGGALRTLTVVILLFFSAGCSRAFAADVGRCPVHFLSRAKGVGILQLRSGDTPIRLADPFVKREPNGKIRVYGTSSGEYVEYPSERALFAGLPPIQRKITFVHPDGSQLSAEETPWDTLPFSCGTKSFLISGIMTPPPGSQHATFPDDNRRRRTYVFTPDENDSSVFVRSKTPLLPDADLDSWIGHNYGHDFIRDENKKPVRNVDGSYTLIYERVTRFTETGKLITEIASRALSCPDLNLAEEKIVLRIDDKEPWPAVQRKDGGLLIEGPRVMKMRRNKQNFYVMGFSSGDFPTDHYGINLAFSFAPEGPYSPVLTEDGTDLRDFGADLRELYGLSWGPARPDFYRDRQGKMWVAFHGVEKKRYPGADFDNWPTNLSDFHREIFLVPFEVQLNRFNQPEFHLGEIQCGREGWR
jgi:hypothetical protein